MTNNYHQKKMDFLDSLEPDDLRNGESFNQMEAIIDSLNESFLKSANAEESIKKAVTNLFRVNSPAIAKAIDLAKTYLEIKN